MSVAVSSRALALALALAFAEVEDLARSLTTVPAFDRDLGRHRAVAEDLALTRVLADARVLVQTLDRDLVRAFGLVRDLISAVARARTDARSLDFAVALTRRGPERVTASTSRLLAAVARLLPAADRARHAEECQSELWDLALFSNGRVRQLWYALHQLRNALPMSVELRSPRRRSAAS
jgi:hypothetical protein